MVDALMNGVHPGSVSLGFIGGMIFATFMVFVIYLLNRWRD